MSFPYPDCSTSTSQPPNTDTTISCRPFIVKFLNGRIKVCKGPHLKAVNELLLPPNDISILHTEPLKYINPCTGMESMLIATLTVLASAKSTPTSHQASYLAQRRMSSACNHLISSFYMLWVILCIEYSFKGTCTTCHRTLTLLIL